MLKKKGLPTEPKEGIDSNTPLALNFIFIPKFISSKTTNSQRNRTSNFWWQKICILSTKPKEDVDCDTLLAIDSIFIPTFWSQTPLKTKGIEPETFDGKKSTFLSTEPKFQCLFPDHQLSISYLYQLYYLNQFTDKYYGLMLNIIYTLLKATDRSLSTDK
jgi:hypothetical protein